MTTTTRGTTTGDVTDDPQRQPLLLVQKKKKDEDPTFALHGRSVREKRFYPPDPVTLMKSRFSAYAKGKAKYVVMTTHSENEIKKDGSKTTSGVKVSTLEADVIATCEKVEFYGLKIANEKKKNETEHLVSFSYNCRVRGQKGFDRGREETQSELSTFRKEEDGKWYFLDGIQGA